MNDNLELIASHVYQILRLLGEDPEREGLKETPMRVAKVLLEYTQGLRIEAPDIKQFTNEEYYDDLIVIRDIPFYSLCEHHLVPFFGKVTVAYEPLGTYMGLSKAVRVTDYYAQRPQVQERLTRQIGEHLYYELNPRGLMVIITAEHLCMSSRGVKKNGSSTVTTAKFGHIDEEQVFRRLQLDHN